MRANLTQRDYNLSDSGEREATIVRDEIELWTRQQSDAWEVIPSGAGGAYRLLHHSAHVLYCRDAPTRGYVNVFVEHASESDVGALWSFGQSGARFEASRRGVRVLVLPDHLDGLLEWCRRRERVGTLSIESGPSNDSAPASITNDEGTGALEAKVRQLVEPGWPHDFNAFVSSTGDVFRAYPPVYFVGELSSLSPGFTLFIGMNPNIRPNDKRYIREINAGFEPYWRTCTGYFSGQFFNWDHYQVHVNYLAGMLGYAEPIKVRSDGGEFLNKQAAAIDLCPLSSPSARGLSERLRTWRKNPTWDGFRLSAQVLETVVTHGRPARIVARYSQTRDLVVHWYGQKSASSVRIGSEALPLYCIPNKPRQPGSPGGNPSLPEAFLWGRAAGQ